LEKIKESVEEIQEKVKDVIDSNIAYYKLWLFKVVTKSATVVLKVLLLAFFFGNVSLFFFHRLSFIFRETI
jgi:hypothetical protein